MASSGAKVARGVEHLKALYAEMDGWGDLDPIHVGRTVNHDGTEHLFHVAFDPPGDFDRWGLLLGDGVHNLRSALDHVVYALARSMPGNDPPANFRQLQFPICSSDEAFKGNRWHIKSLTKEMQASIERLQPYNRRQPNGFAPLEWLAFLDDVDKHRILHLMAIGIRPNMFNTFDIGANPGTFKAELANRTTMEGAPFLRITLTEPNPDMYVDLHMSTSVVVDGEPTWGNTGVQQLMGHVETEVSYIRSTLAELIPK